MTRDSREFSAALVLGALGGAALAMALKSGSSHGRPRAWSDLVAGLDWPQALAGLRTVEEPKHMEALQRVSLLLREMGSQVTPGRR